jgi:hypothetical protein
MFTFINTKVLCVSFCELMIFLNLLQTETSQICKLKLYNALNVRFKRGFAERITTEEVMTYIFIPLHSYFKIITLFIYVMQL